MPVATQELTKAFGWNQQQTNEQQDAFEMWEKLLEAIRRGMQWSPNESTVSDMFSGKVRSFISCTKIDYETSRIETFYNLSLLVRGNRSLDDSFREYTELLPMDGDSQYYAGDQYKFQDAVKGTQFEHFPPVLVLHLRWFEYDYTRDLLETVDQDYEFPEEFDATPYLSPSGKEQLASWKYTLYSIITHRGTTSHGYNNVFLRPAKDGSFYKFDNHRVTRTTLKDIKEANFGVRAGLYSWKPMILIYVRKSSLDTLLDSQ